MSAFALARLFNRQPATVSNSIIINFSCKTEEQIQQIYAKVLKLADADEYAPGHRDEGFYAGYFWYSERNKRNAFVLG